MGLSYDVISQFAKIVNKDKKESTGTTVYGTIIEENSIKYVKLDGSDQLTPLNDDTDLSRDFITATVKNKDRVTVLVKDHSAIVTGNLTRPAVIADDIAAFNKDTTDQVAINTAYIENLQADAAKFGYLKTAYGEIAELDAKKASIEQLNAVTGNIENLDATYASIDFSNIGKAAMEYFYANSGLIKDVVVGDQTITGKLVGVTISGDLIEANTLKAEKLVIKGSDGLYYKLNTDGVKIEAEQTDENSINGQVIKAKSITATKISVSDLVAFDATIGGFNITDNSIYSGVKESVNNTTRGIYLDSDGQMSLGDANRYFTYYKDSDDSYKLKISVDSLSINGQTVDEKIDDIQVGGRNLLQKSNPNKWLSEWLPWQNTTAELLDDDWLKVTNPETKNYLEGLSVPTSLNGVTFAKNTDGSISVGGKATSIVSFDWTTIELPAGTYTFSGCPELAKDWILAILLKPGETFATMSTDTIYVSSYSKKSVEFTLEDAKTLTLHLYIASGASVSGNFNLELNSPNNQTIFGYYPPKISNFPIAGEYILSFEAYKDSEQTPSTNLLDGTTRMNGLIEVNGIIQTGSSYIASYRYYEHYIPVSEGDIISFQFDYNGTRHWSVTSTEGGGAFTKIAAYDSNKNVLSSLGSNSVTKQYTVPSGVAFIRISLSSTTDKYENIAVVANATDVLPYEPYGQIIDSMTLNYNYIMSNESGNTKINDIPITAEPSRYTIPIITTKPYANGSIMLGSTTGTSFYVRNIKFELGNKATDYTEAPEDVEIEIDDASKTATNFLNYDSANGLQVGNKTSGSWSGFRSQITSTAFNILNAAGTVLASYGEKLIELGRNATDAVIKFCGGKGQINYDSDDKSLQLTGDSVRLKGDTMASVYAKKYDGSTNANASSVNVSPESVNIFVQKSENIDPETLVGEWTTSEVTITPDEITAISDDVNLTSRNNVNINSINGAVIINDKSLNFTDRIARAYTQEANISYGANTYIKLLRADSSTELYSKDIATFNDNGTITINKSMTALINVHIVSGNSGGRSWIRLMNCGSNWKYTDSINYGSYTTSQINIVLPLAKGTILGVQTVEAITMNSSGLTGSYIEIIELL